MMAVVTILVLAVIVFAAWKASKAIRGSRGARKFRRSKMAMTASIVIGVYLLIAVLVTLGMISKDDTEERVGPRRLPGFGIQQAPEDRYGALREEVRKVKYAAESKEPAKRLGELRFGERRPASVPVEELLARAAKAETLFKELDKSADLDVDEAAWPKLEEAEAAVADLFEPLSGWSSLKQGLLLSLGTDRKGRSISARSFYAIKIAVQIGLVASLFSVIVGGLLGAAAAYFGGLTDHIVQWLYSTFSSIPSLVLLGVLVFAFTGSKWEETLLPVYAAFCVTLWIGPCRVVRGEALRLKELDYVQAAQAVGASRWRVLLRHIVPNTSHLIFVNFSLLFIGAIKSEVILTFLGLGVKNEPSWGIMISQSKQEVVNDFFWQIGSATALMFVLVLAFNIFTDALQDALDPKHIG